MSLSARDFFAASGDRHAGPILISKRTPSSAVNRARCSAITSSFRWPFAKVISGSRYSATNAAIAAMKALLIGAIRARRQTAITIASFGWGIFGWLKHRRAQPRGNNASE